MSFCSKWVLCLFTSSLKNSSFKIAEKNTNYNLHNIFTRYLKKQANQLRPGNVIEHKGHLLLVIKAEHNLGTARQLGNVQVSFKDIKTQQNVIERFKPSDSLETAFLEEKKFIYLYTENDNICLMNPITYEQIEVNKEVFGDHAKYLTDDLEVRLFMHDGHYVNGNVPNTIVMKVAKAAPKKIAEASSSRYKEVIMTNGLKVQVPPFIEEGEMIVIGSQDGRFIRRANR